MQDINKMRFDDFYFNGDCLSNFEGEVAGKGQSPLTSSLPSKAIQTEKIPSRDGEFVYGSTYNPRTFVVPIMLNNINRIKDVSKWLNVKTPAPFYYADDRVYINAMFDNVIDFESGYLQGGIGGISEVKFIAHDPFYYLIDDLKYVITNFADIDIFNDGNIESCPKIRINTSDVCDVIIGVNGTTFKIKNVNGYVDIDSLYETVMKGTENKYFDMEGEFPLLIDGYNSLSVVGSACTSIEVQCRSRWI